MTSEATCANCKWWGTAPDEHDDWRMTTEPTIQRKTIDEPRVPAPGPWGWCKKVDTFGPGSPATRFYVIDGSDFLAALSTRGDFGCVEHEPNPASEGDA